MSTILFKVYPKIQIQVPYPLLSALSTFIGKTNYRTFHIHHLHGPIFFQLFEFGVKVLTKKSTKGFIENLKYLCEINAELSLQQTNFNDISQGRPKIILCTYDRTRIECSSVLILDLLIFGKMQKDIFSKVLKATLYLCNLVGIC